MSYFTTFFSRAFNYGRFFLFLFFFVCGWMGGLVGYVPLTMVLFLNLYNLIIILKSQIQEFDLVCQEMYTYHTNFQFM